MTHMVTLPQRDLGERFRKDMATIRAAARIDPALGPLFDAIVTAAENIPDHTDGEAWRWSPVAREAKKLADAILGGEGGDAA